LCFDSLANRIEAAPATAPIATLCRRYCNNEDIPSCAVAALGLVGGYFTTTRRNDELALIVEFS